MNLSNTRPLLTCRPIRHRWVNLFTLSLVASCLLVATPLLAQPDRPGWEALPQEAVLCVRMPGTADFIERIREQTALGQRVLTPGRIDGFRQLFLEDNGEPWESFVGELENVGLSAEDLLEMAQAPCGAALIVQPRGDDQLPRLILIGWADLREDQIDRIFAAQERTMEEAQETSEYPPTRIDLDLAGVPVRQISTPETNWFEDDGGEWNESVVDRTHLLMARVPGRMILAVGVPQSEDRVLELLDGGDDIDWEAATDVMSVQAVMTRYLAATQDGGDGAFVARMLAQPDAAAAVPMKDASLFEVYGDVAALIRLGRQAAVSDGTGPEVFDQFINGLGLDGLGVMAMSYYLQGGALQGRAWFEVRQPRRGLLATVSRQTLPAAPPDWVSADLRYAHLAYDLSTLYDVIVEVAMAMGGDEVGVQLEMANNMTRAQTQSDIPGILRGLGIGHHIVLLPSRNVTMEVDQWDFDNEQMETVETELLVQPVALVWSLPDAGLWQRVMTVATGFSAMAAGEISTVEEQGFRGLRTDATGLPTALMLGPNHLVLGVGPDVTARTLSLLNNPPAPADRLANSALIDEARAILGDALRPGFFFQIEDGSASMIDAKRELLLALTQTSDDAAAAMVERLKALLPTDEELRESFGVTASVGSIGDTGFRLDTVFSLPAP